MPRRIAQTAPPPSANPDEHPLKRWRQAQEPRVSQEDIATRLGTTKATISRIEGRLQDPSVPIIRRIIAVTRGAVTADQLIKQIPAPREARDTTSEAMAAS